MSENRTIFLDNDDMAYGVGFDRIEQIQIPSFESIDINDAIEFFEIKRYFDNGLRVKDWSDEQYSEYCEKSKKLFGITMRFVKGLKDSTILEVYRRINGHFYHKPFWILFDKCSLYNEISPSIFDQLLHNESVSLYDILSHKKIAKQYGMVIRDFILETLDHIPLLLQVYEQDYIEKKVKLFLPDELKAQDISNYFERYINSDFPNLNYLKKIVQMRSKDPFCISDIIKLKASRRYDEKRQEVFEHGVSIPYGLEVIFSPDQEEEKVEKEGEENTRIYSYSQKWLLETLDYPDVLSNFIYLFEFVDYPQLRFLHVAKSFQSDPVERAMQSESKRQYPEYHSFDFNNRLSCGQMALYYYFLKKNDVRLEAVLEWFFNVYLQEEYGCAAMNVLLPSEGSSYSEKCTSICTALESAEKQFSLFVEFGEIDFDLLALMSGSKRIDDIPSLIDKKYIYGVGETFAKIQSFLFSDQCTFSFVKRIYKEGRTYPNFYQLIKSENVYLTDYFDNDQKTFHWLAEQKLLTINADGLIKPGDPWKTTIAMDLFMNEVISFRYYPTVSKPVFDEWIKKGYLETKSSLFSRPEAKYYNYIMNDADFDNGLKLRNKYSHGNQSGITDERIHESNYMIFLKLFVLLAIKINDDFSLKEQQEQMNQEA